MLTPRAGEQFFLRMLLLAKPARSYQGLRTVAGVTYETFRAAAQAYGLLEIDNEYEVCMKEAISNLFVPSSLRSLFVILVENGADALKLIDNYFASLAADFLERDSQSARDLLLADLHSRFRFNGNDGSRYGIPEPQKPLNELDQEKSLLISSKQTNEAVRDINIGLLTSEQKEIFDRVMHAVKYQQELPIFLQARAGRGKTFLLRTLTASVRALSKIVIVVATTGIAAIDHERGTTAHNRFGIPLRQGGAFEAVESTIEISSAKAQILKAAELFIWDEVPMCHRLDIECVDRFLRRLFNSTRMFGGKPMILAGDWHQIPPVVPGSGVTQTLQASLKHSQMWKDITQVVLTLPQRDSCDVGWSAYVDKVGDGSSIDRITDSAGYIPLLPNIRKFYSEDDAIRWTFPELHTTQACVGSGILCCLNSSVDEMNKKILSLCPGQLTEFRSCDSVVSTDDRSSPFTSIEFLHTLSVPGVPDYCLQLKPGALCMIIRNVSAKQGAMNGTRIVVERIISQFLIEAKNLATGENILIPRINFQFPVPKMPIVVNRRQFPIRLCYALTINKSQGKTLDRVCVDLRNPVFSHGQLYVAFGRVRRREDLSVLLGESSDRVLNVVYDSLLQCDD